MDIKDFESRKIDHLQVALDSRVQARGQSGLDQIHLNHEALPEIDFEEISIAQTCLGWGLATPFYISGMTAGHQQAVLLNQRFARACASRGWAMGVGSQRREYENGVKGLSESVEGMAEDIDAWKSLRDESPELSLFSNLGLSQVIEAYQDQRFDDVKRLVDVLEASALVVHTNPLQEILQKEGTPRFAGGLQALESLCSQMRVPVVLKETGCGFSLKTLKACSEIGLAAIDVSGLGGTHWGRVEGLRGQNIPLLHQAAQTFANWGESTVQSVKNARQVFHGEIWASGGVRSGLDAAKLLALGAHRVGYAKPALEAALKGDRELDEWMQLQEFELKVALFCTGSKMIEDLRAMQLEANSSE